MMLFPRSGWPVHIYEEAHDARTTTTHQECMAIRNTGGSFLIRHCNADLGIREPLLSLILDLDYQEGRAKDVALYIVPFDNQGMRLNANDLGYVAKTVQLELGMTQLASLCSHRKQ